MRRTILIGFALLTAVGGAVATYGLLSVLFLGLSKVNGPASLLIRVVALNVLLIGITFISARKLWRGERRGLAVAAAVAAYVLMLIVISVPFVQGEDPDPDILRKTVSEINASRGEVLSLPHDRSYLVRRIESNGPYEELRIQVTDRPLAKIFGVDLRPSNEIAVELRDGQVWRAWVSYF